MQLNLQKLNANWADLKAFLQAKVKVIGDVRPHSDNHG